MKIHTYIGAVLVAMILAHSTVKSFDLPGEAPITKNLGIRPLIIIFDPHNVDGYKQVKRRCTRRCKNGRYAAILGSTIATIET